METPPKWLAKGYILLFALLPWSVDCDFGRWNLSLPSEPLIAGLGIGLVWLFWQSPQAFLGAFFKNIFLQISFLYLAWMAVSACFSSLPIVSWKYWLVAVAHWWVFAVGISVWPELWRKALPGFAFSMVGLGVYTLIHHGFYDFRADQAMLAPMPFFPDHTMWAAAVVIVLFLFGTPNLPIPQIALKRRWGQWYRFVQYSILALALIFSTCRAAWASVLIAGFLVFRRPYTALSLYLPRTGCWRGRQQRQAAKNQPIALVGVLANKLFSPRTLCCILSREKGRKLLLLGLMVALFLVASIFNARPLDVSALERLNRWSCAIRMAQDQPVLGFGPGTFQFQYLDYQKPEEMTRISLRVPAGDRGPDNYGRGGGAHSEYLRALSETGWPGLLLWLGLLGAVLRFKKDAWWHSLALLTFLMHSLVNDFLHDDRIAALVWGCMAMIFSARKED